MTISTIRTAPAYSPWTTPTATKTGVDNFILGLGLGFVEYEVSEGIGVVINGIPKKSIIKLPIINGKVNGQILVEEYLEIYGRSIQHKDSNVMTLGKYLRDDKTDEVLPEAYTEMEKNMAILTLT